MYGVAFSLGAIILGKYLGQSGKDSVLTAATCVCPPLDIFKASEGVENNLYGFYSRWLGAAMRK